MTQKPTNQNQHTNSAKGSAPKQSTQLHCCVLGEWQFWFYQAMYKKNQFINAKIIKGLLFQAEY